jgi:hypothetical protein
MIPEPTLSPLLFGKRFWPHVYFYREQQEILRSVEQNIETYVPAGNMLGKDFVAGFIALWFFMTRHPCRVVTTSAKAEHLRVLWGEIGAFINSCNVALDARRGGPLIINHQEIKRYRNGEKDPKSYVIGMVASEDTIAAMGGHHVAATGDGVPRTLFIADEASSVPDTYYEKAITWADRVLVIGNCWPCQNFFKRAVKDGDQKATTGNKDSYFRRVLKITAEDSPNIRLARSQLAGGTPSSGEQIVPGVKGWERYQRECAMWDEHQKTVAHKAEFYEGAEVMLFPAEWLNRANELPQNFARNRKAKAIGIDPGEGSADTALVAVDELGLIELIALKTPDTSVIESMILAFAKKHGLIERSEMWMIDRGGGGKQIADRLRRTGHRNVRTVAFGESIQKDIKRAVNRDPFDVRLDVREDRYTYLNRRAEMYGELSMLLDPAINGKGFGIPVEYGELRRQLVPIPKQYDQEGRLFLPPKNAKPDASGKVNENHVTLVKILGCSPDEADAVVLACHGMLHKPRLSKAGAVA